MERHDAPSGPHTYAVGDLHGEVTLLRRLLQALPLRAEDTLVFLGDYLDRGEDSAATIAALRVLELERACVFLRGNHEDSWLDVWNGVYFPRPPSISGARKAWHDFGGQVPVEVGQWLAGTRIDYEDDHAFYVHAGVLPGQPFWRTPPLQKLWGAGSFLESAYDWGKPVVFGHWQLPEPLVLANKIGIDTGAYQSGVLTAVRLPDRAIFQVRR
ncbi:MAG TPA: metallophosphoesterase [Chloroflexota bacterium]|nr:metallophosphoesterase [Chloroflexota bacterium]